MYLLSKGLDLKDEQGSVPFLQKKLSVRDRDVKTGLD